MSARLVKNINQSGSSSPDSLISSEGILYFAADISDASGINEQPSFNDDPIPEPEPDPTDDEPVDDISEDEEDSDQDDTDTGSDEEESDQDDTDPDDSDEDDDDPDPDDNDASQDGSNDNAGDPGTSSGSVGFWKSDGSDGGTILVKSFDSVSSIVEVGAEIFFVAGVGDAFELWKSDGTSGGTTRVKQLYPFSFSPFPPTLFEVDNVLYFSAEDPSSGKYPYRNGYELYRWEGEANGVNTAFFRNLIPDRIITEITELTETETTGTGDDAVETEVVVGATVTTEAFDNDSFPRNFIGLNGNIFFVAASSNRYTFETFTSPVTFGGFELWFSDGTEGGTRPIQINNQDYTFYYPEDGSYKPYAVVQQDSFGYGTKSSSSFPRQLATYKNRLYLTANDGVHGFELWSVNDKGKDLKLIEDLRAGTLSSSPEELTVASKTLYFTANSGSGRQIHYLTENNTIKAIDQSGTQPRNLTEIGGKVYYSAISDKGRELWVIDNKKAEQVQDINPGTSSSSPSRFTLVERTLKKKTNNIMYFSATDGKRGIELWSLNLSDKNAQAERATDIFSGPTSSDPRELINSDQNLFFTADDGKSGRELWTLGPAIKGPTGGIGAGSSRIKIRENESFIYQFTTSVDSPTSWSTQGGEDADLFTINRKNGKLSFKDEQDFERPDDSNRNNIYEVVVRVKDKDTNLASDQYVKVEVVNVEESGPNDGEIEDDPAKEDTNGGTDNDNDNDNQPDSNNDDQPGNTKADFKGKRIKDIWSKEPSSNPNNIISYDGKLIFSANNGKKGSELWSSSGSKKSTTLFSDIWKGSSSSSPSDFQPVNNKVYFSASNDEFGRELWILKNSKKQPDLAYDINPGVNSSSPSDLAVLDSTLMFTANDGEYGRELWMAKDGNSPSLVKDLVPGIRSSNPTGTTPLNSNVYFAADHITYGRELWASNGSASQTYMVLDLNPGGFGSDPMDLTVLNQKLYFTAQGDYLSQREIYASDGTAGGTRELSIEIPADLTVESENVDFENPEGLTESGGNLFFSGKTLLVSRREKVVSTTTTNNAQDDNDNDSDPANPDGDNENDTNNNESSTETTKQLEIVEEKTLYGRELWTSDGSIDGMRFVKDIFEGQGSSNPKHITSINNKVYFNANDGISGEELWVSDGTDEGTKQLTDINKGAASSSPSNIVEHKGEIYFSAKTNKYGQELYILGSRSSKQTSNKTATRIVEDRKGSAKLRARQRASDEFLFRQSGQFGPKQADRIMNFNSQEGDYIALDPSAFKNLKKLNFKSVGSTTAFIKQAEAKSQLIYFEPVGELYFDQNGSKPGFGSGGLFAILDGTPSLNAADITVI